MYPWSRLNTLKKNNDWTRYSISNSEMDQSCTLSSEDVAALCSGELKNLNTDAIHVPAQNAEHTLQGEPILQSEPIVTVPLRCDCRGDNDTTIQRLSYSATDDCRTNEIYATSLAAGASENLLVQPEMNSTLRIRNDIARLIEHECDLPNFMKLKVDSKTKLKIDEKVSVEDLSIIKNR